MSKEVVLGNGIKVTGVTLLTIEEAEKLTKEIRSIGCWWWLCSPGHGSNVAGVNSAGLVDYIGISAHLYDHAVRPALILDLKDSDLEIGDRFNFRDKKFEIISGTKALCLESIGECAFRRKSEALDANDYSVSDVKKYVDDWYEGVESPRLRSYTVDEVFNAIWDTPFSSLRNCDTSKEVAEVVIANMMDRYSE